MDMDGATDTQESDNEGHGVPTYHRKQIHRAQKQQGFLCV